MSAAGSTPALSEITQQPLAAERPNKSVPCLPRSLLGGCYQCQEEQGCGRVHTQCLHPWAAQRGGAGDAKGWGGTTSLCFSRTAMRASAREFPMEKGAGVMLEWRDSEKASPYNLCCPEDLLSAGSVLVWLRSSGCSGCHHPVHGACRWI